MPLLLPLQKLQGKGDEGWKKVSVFAEDRECVGKKCVFFFASYSTSNKLLHVARYILITGLQKCI